MVAFPNAKINLGLRVTAKRTDGYHDIETVFYPVCLKEALELTRLAPSKLHDYDFEFTLTGNPVPGEQQTNLCYKAYQLIKKDYPINDHLRMHLHKTIPTGAGLGGGSADGAAALKLLNTELKLHIPPEELAAYALMLGSDCPFFLINKPCLARGRGEILAPIDINLENYYFVIVHPDIHISTAWAYSAIIPGKQRSPITEVISTGIENWKDRLINDFQEPVFEKYPSIKLVHEELYAGGAIYASLSGSGSAVYGIFANEVEFQSATISGLHNIYILKPQS